VLLVWELLSVVHGAARWRHLWYGRSVWSLLRNVLFILALWSGALARSMEKAVAVRAVHKTRARSREFRVNAARSDALIGPERSTTLVGLDFTTQFHEVS
jgi:hypothetical protein